MSEFADHFYYEWLSVSLVVILIALAYVLYFRVTTDMAYLRTGLGKPKVLRDSGGFVLPFLHTLTPVSLQMYSLEIVLQGRRSLVMQDLLRVDMHLVCSVRVAVSTDNILTAIRVLGSEGLQRSTLRGVLMAEALSVISARATGLTLESLHQNRHEFIEVVSQHLNRQWQQYGLEMVSVALVSIGQTDKAHYDPMRVLDAKGLALLERRQFDSEKQRHVQQCAAEMAARRRHFEAAVQRMEWERSELMTHLQHIRFKVEADSKAALELGEIQVAKEIALEMVQRDVELTRIQTEQELAVARQIAPLSLTVSA